MLVNFNTDETLLIARAFVGSWNGFWQFSTKHSNMDLNSTLSELKFTYFNIK